MTIRNYSYNDIFTINYSISKQDLIDCKLSSGKFSTNSPGFGFIIKAVARVFSKSVMEEWKKMSVPKTVPNSAFNVTWATGATTSSTNSWTTFINSGTAGATLPYGTRVSTPGRSLKDDGGELYYPIGKSAFDAVAEQLLFAGKFDFAELLSTYGSDRPVEFTSGVKLTVDRFGGVKLQNKNNKTIYKEDIVNNLLNQISRAGILDVKKAFKDQVIKIAMPDDSVIFSDGKGNYSIDDTDQKVIYKANNSREFNRFINASDLLKNFIQFLAECDVKQNEILQVPIELFINWLVFKACEADGEDTPENLNSPEKILKLEDKRLVPRCKACGKFITKAKHLEGIEFCGGEHLVFFMQKRGIK